MIPKLKLFEATTCGDVLIVAGKSQSGSFMYNELHLETNYVRQYLDQNMVRKLILDLSEVDYFGSEYLGTLILIKNSCDRFTGVTALTGLSSKSFDVISRAHLFDDCPVFMNRDSAIYFFQRLS